MDEQPSGLLLELTCALDAPPKQIFRMLTEPVELAKWWGPHGFTMPDSELDLRVGGDYRFSMRPPDGDLFHLCGEFLEISPPSRLVYTFRWEEPTPDDRETIVTLTLDELQDGTEISLSQGLFANEERLSLHRSGWTDSFERLRVVVEPGS